MNKEIKNNLKEFLKKINNFEIPTKSNLIVKRLIINFNIVLIFHIIKDKKK